MGQIKESAAELIGETPILKLNHYAPRAGVENAVILAKLEYLNPAGSVKDTESIWGRVGIDRRRKRYERCD